MLFIILQKLFSFSRYLSFYLDFLVMQQNGLIRKIRLISIFMTSLPGSRTIKFGQLIEYNMRKIFLEKSSTKCGGETSPRLFSGKLKLSISLDQQSKTLYSLFSLHPKLRAMKYIETKLQTTCFYLILSIFKK